MMSLCQWWWPGRAVGRCWMGSWSGSRSPTRRPGTRSPGSRPNAPAARWSRRSVRCLVRRSARSYKKYGDESVSVVRNEAYRLAADVWGIGFKTADTIARSVGIAPDSPERIKAGLAYTLSEAADDGHCYLPAPNLIADAAKILDVPAELIAPCLDELAAAEGVVRETVPAAARPDRAEAAP